MVSDPAKGPSLSVSTGDYLKAILASAGPDSASTKDISERLSVAPASVTNMLGRLQEMGFVHYERYRGASLTDRGREEALRLLRRHRLIETFLLEHLGYSWQEVHDEAERLEHAVSDTFTERLAELLGHPDRDPHGDPIPTTEGTLEPDNSFPLSGATAGQKVCISRVSGEDDAVLAYLWEHGLVPGLPVEVKEVRDLDGVVTIEDKRGASRSLGRLLADSILVRRLPEAAD